MSGRSWCGLTLLVGAGCADNSPPSPKNLTVVVEGDGAVDVYLTSGHPYTCSGRCSYYLWPDRHNGEYGQVEDLPDDGLVPLSLGGSTGVHCDEDRARCTVQAHGDAKYTVKFTYPEAGAEVCGNVLDDDGDGDFDCQDADCVGSPDCSFSTFEDDCTDGNDDDGDLQIDCDDPDCAADPTCDTGAPRIGVTPPSYTFPYPATPASPQLSGSSISNAGGGVLHVSSVAIDDGAQETGIWIWAPYGGGPPPWAIQGDDFQVIQYACQSVPYFTSGTDEMDLVILSDDPINPELRVPVTCTVAP